MEGAKKMGESVPVSIPVQMLSLTNRDGVVTPIWFKLETEDHTIEKIAVEKVISRDESNSVGIRESKFICSVVISGTRHLIELRYHLLTRRWRIFQFLS